MDRNFIKFCTKQYPRIYTKVIREYCIEKGKRESLTDIFIAILRADPQYLKHCYDISLEYYQTKFNLQIWSDDKRNIITII